MMGFGQTKVHRLLLHAVAPAVLAARAIAEDRFPEHGLVMPNRHVELTELLNYLQCTGIEICEVADVK
jgi:hypothetical protein